MNKKKLFPCRQSVVQEYDCCVFVVPRWKSSHKYICFDKCLANELFFLWDKGIITTGCCCDHHVSDHGIGNGKHAYIGVSKEFIPFMKKLGYKVSFNKSRPGDEDSFTPKTNFNL